MNTGTVILGAGISGLSAGYKRKIKIFEASSFAGGICRTYYVPRPKSRKLISPKSGSDTYRFEVGGGHWIFGTDQQTLALIKKISPVKRHIRNATIFFPNKNLLVPFPIQHHLQFLPHPLRTKITKELTGTQIHSVKTMADWLFSHFGKTLCRLFFFPFHERYTCGLFHNIAPQDLYKTPGIKEIILGRDPAKVASTGYNSHFVYPKNGLDVLIQGLAKGCDIDYNKKAIKIDLKSRQVLFEDGTSTPFKKIISTLPLNRVLELTGLNAGDPDPHTSVLVINLGATKGPNCPNTHWLFIPESRSGIHRIGFYSHVERSFLPSSLRQDPGSVSLYIEKSYPGRMPCPSEQQIQKTLEKIIAELKEWGIISKVEVSSPTWIPLAYTWRKPGSRWVENSLKILTKHNIIQIGRYGRWQFQGIAQSMREGRAVKL